VDEAIRRNSLRSGVERVPDHVILDMDRVFEEPNPKKNHWEKNTIVLDMELCSVFPFDIVSLFMENPIVEGKEKQVIEENIDSKWFDEFEKASRRVLSDFLKSSQRPKSRGYVEKLNSIRRRFVNEKRESFNEFHSEKDSACILNDLISDLRMCFENCEN
jgi:tRNA uridine 5-carbamoylmethylation protein Kti12